MHGMPPDHMMVMRVGGPPGRGSGGRRRNEDGFDFRMVFQAFTSLPRVSKLVWTTQPFFTLALGLINIARGFSPALSAWITKLVIDSVVNAVSHKGEVSAVV